jgi:hypothetical protein
MPRASPLSRPYANNNCTHPRHLTPHVRVPSAVVYTWYCAQCGQLVEPAGPCPKTHAEFRKVW